MTLPAISPFHSVDAAVSEQRQFVRRSPSTVPVVCESSAPSEDQRIHAWLLLLLRFAISLDAKDESAVMAVADELDGLGLDWRPIAPTFFRRTSSEVCKAIATPDDPARMAVLKTHCTRIDDRRLRRAFEAAIDLDQSGRPMTRSRAATNLWVGLKR